MFLHCIMAGNALIWDLYGGSSTASPGVEEISGVDIPWLAVSLGVIGFLLLLVLVAAICLCSSVRAWFWGLCGRPVALDGSHPGNVLAMESPPIPAGSVSDDASGLVEVIVASPISLQLPVLPLTVSSQAGLSDLWCLPVVEAVAIGPDCTEPPIPPVRSSSRPKFTPSWYRGPTTD